MLQQKIEELKGRYAITTEAKENCFTKMNKSHFEYVKTDRLYGADDIRTAAALQEYEQFYALWDKLDNLQNALYEAITHLVDAQIALDDVNRFGKDLLK